MIVHYNGTAEEVLEMSGEHLVSCDDAAKYLHPHLISTIQCALSDFP